MKELSKEESNNDLIAEFMGARYVNDAPDDYPDGYWVWPVGSFNTGNEFWYDESWDWLMSVVQNIAKIHDSTFHYDVDKIRNGDWPKDNQYMDVIALPLSTQIDEVYKAVVKFIKWYQDEKGE